MAATRGGWAAAKCGGGADSLISLFRSNLLERIDKNPCFTVSDSCCNVGIFPDVFSFFERRV